MADVENQHDSSFPVKRKPDIHCQEHDNVANKAQKLNPSADSESRDGEINESGIENLVAEGDIVAESAVSPVKTAGGSVSEKDENGVSGDFEAEEEQEGEDLEEVEEEEEEEEEEDDSSEDEIEIDRKGKGISREDKGKGKMMEEDESDDNDDDDDDEDVVDESDFSDDPLAEVDLDNILPSRTRRRSSQPGLFISNQITDRGGGGSSDDSEV